LDDLLLIIYVLVYCWIEICNGLCALPMCGEMSPRMYIIIIIIIISTCELSHECQISDSSFVHINSYPLLVAVVFILSIPYIFHMIAMETSFKKMTDIKLWLLILDFYCQTGQTWNKYIVHCQKVCSYIWIKGRLFISAWYDGYVWIDGLRATQGLMTIFNNATNWPKPSDCLFIFFFLQEDWWSKIPISFFFQIWTLEWSCKHVTR